MGVLQLTDPVNHCPSGYSLHLYCKYQNPAHGFREFPWEMDEWETYGQAAAEARKAGWILHRDRTATCPKCRSILNTQEPTP